MRIKTHLAAGLVLGALLAAGCGGDLGAKMMANPEVQNNIMGTIAGHSLTASLMMDRLLASDSARAIVIDKSLANGATAQQLLLAVAKNPTMLDGVINLAVQDPATKDHVLTLFRGMQMAGVK